MRPMLESRLATPRQVARVAFRNQDPGGLRTRVTETPGDRRPLCLRTPAPGSQTRGYQDPGGSRPRRTGDPVWYQPQTRDSPVSAEVHLAKVRTDNVTHPRARESNDEDRKCSPMTRDWTP